MVLLIKSHIWYVPRFTHQAVKTCKYSTSSTGDARRRRPPLKPRTSPCPLPTAIIDCMAARTGPSKKLTMQRTRAIRVVILTLNIHTQHLIQYIRSQVILYIYTQHWVKHIRSRMALDI